MKRERTMRKQWYRLDNAALIFPAVMRKNWNNVFRVSVTLKDAVDPELLSRAAAELLPRFPAVFVRLRTGFFWYYLESVAEAPKAEEDYAWPLTPMSRRKLRKCCIRILYYRNRIAVEFFHSVTDGTGGMAFLQNLAARYLALKEGGAVPPEGNIVDIVRHRRRRRSATASSCARRRLPFPARRRTRTGSGEIRRRILSGIS